MIKNTPECPFCGKVIVRPEDTQTEFGKVLYNRCSCGAVYVCDPTGHNTGEAYMEGLALLKGSWDIDILDPGFDYEAEEMDYDLRSNTRIFAKGMSGHSGKLLFLRFKKEGEAGLPLVAGTKESGGRKTEGRVINIKEKIREALEANRLDEITAIGLQDKGAFRRLIAMAYDKEDVKSWRAMEALGLLSGAASKDRMEVVRDTVRRLLWSMGEESGGIGWSAAEMLGEIIMNCPDGFTDIVPILWSFKDEDMFRSGIVWAMGRIGRVRIDLVQFVSGPLTAMLADRDPLVRGYAAWTLGIIGDRTQADGLKALACDACEINFYTGGVLVRRKVGEIAAEALNKLEK